MYFAYYKILNYYYNIRDQNLIEHIFLYTSVFVMDHSRVIDVIRSERFTLVEIREENRLQLVNTVNILMNFLSSYSSWIIAWFTRFGNVKSATDNPTKY